MSAMNRLDRAAQAMTFNNIEKLGERLGDQTPTRLGQATSKLVEATPAIIGGVAKVAIGADYFSQSAQGAYNAFADPNNTMLGYQANELPSRGLDAFGHGIVGVISAGLILEGVAQAGRAVSSAFASNAKQAKAVN